MGRAYPGSGLGEAVDLQSLGAELRVYGEIDDPAMRDFNPSIVWHKDKLKISIRRCNFAVHKGGAWYLRDCSAYSKTDVLYGDLDPDTLQVSSIKKLTLSDNTPTRIKVAGLEDVRLFVRKNKIHAVGFESDRLTKSLHNQSAAMAEFVIEGSTLKYLRTLEKPQKDAVEKNWCPPDKPSKDFDYTYSPSQSYKDGALTGSPYLGIVHGGSILLSQKDGTYISIVHDKITLPAPRQVYDKYLYRTYLAHHDQQGIVTKLSKPFRFGTLENIEFASGLAEYKDSFIMTLGIRDCKYAIVKIAKEKLLEL